MKTPREQYYDIERIVEFDFVRATEAAALKAFQWHGRGDAAAANAAASDAMRGMFDLMNICGEAVLGDARADVMGRIDRGEHLGTWLPGTIGFDLALDPIDGERNVARGAPSSMSCLAAASPEDGVKHALREIPSRYMTKLAYGPEVVRHMERTGFGTVQIQHPIEETLNAVAKAVGKRVQDVVVLVMDRPRHATLMEEVRAAGAALRVIADGDIAAAIAPSFASTGVDLYVGTGGSSEAVIAAAAVKCLGGGLQCLMWPMNDAEQERLVQEGHEEALSKIYFADDLASGRNIIFCATGISDGPLMNGVRIDKETVTTHSLLMRAKSRTVRRIETSHDLRTKTIHLRSDNREHRI